MVNLLASLINESIFHLMAPVTMAMLLSGVYDKKRGFAGFSAVGIALAVLVSAFQIHTGGAPSFAAGSWAMAALQFLQRHLWDIYFVAAFVYVKLCFVCTWLAALFCFLVGCCTLHLFFRIAICAGLRSNLVLPVVLLELILSIAFVRIVTALFHRKMNWKTMLAMEKRHSVLILLLSVLAFTLALSSIQTDFAINQIRLLIPEDSQLFSELLPSLHTTFVSGVLTTIIAEIVDLLILYHLLAYTETDLNEELFSTLYRQERLQYEQFKQNVDYINERYHDLRHILTLIKNDRSGAARMLDEVTEKVAFLRSEIDTGDNTLDNILTDRYVRCQQKGIELHLMTDGTTFDWMDTIDLYLIFCNILDNAIEYLETVDQEKVITIGIKTVQQMILIHQGNSLYEDLRTEGGIPVSTKSEAHNHGFGLKSVMATAQRYGGSVTLNTKNGRFSVDILFQKPQQ